jgi:hypothetical protein
MNKRITIQQVNWRGGSIGIGKGVDANNQTIYFAGDWRPLRDMKEALDSGALVEIEIEPWQEISFEEYMGDQAQALTEVGPYVRVTFNEQRTANGTTYRIVAYGAYNASGLIGTECNGILILNEDRRDVVADEIGHDPHYPGAVTQAQLDLARTLHTCSDAEFREKVNNAERLRYTI